MTAGKNFRIRQNCASQRCYKVLRGKAIERHCAAQYCADASVVKAAARCCKIETLPAVCPNSPSINTFADCDRGGSPIYPRLPIKRGTPYTRPIVNWRRRLRRFGPIESIRRTSGRPCAPKRRKDGRIRLASSFDAATRAKPPRRKTAIAGTAFALLHTCLDQLYALGEIRLDAAPLARTFEGVIS
jgi:hypothetical protein